MRDRTRMLAVTTGTLLLSVLVWFNYSAVLPLIVEDWGLSGTDAGVVFGAFQAGYMLAIVPMGMLADRYSPRPVVAGGAVGTGIASLAFAGVATGFLTGTVLRFVGGMAMAGVYVPGMRFVSDSYPESSRGRAMGVYVGGFSFSSGLSFLLASNIAAAVDWRTAVAATSVGRSSPARCSSRWHARAPPRPPGTTVVGSRSTARCSATASTSRRWASTPFTVGSCSECGTGCSRSS